MKSAMDEMLEKHQIFGHSTFVVRTDAKDEENPFFRACIVYGRTLLEQDAAGVQYFIQARNSYTTPGTVCYDYSC